MKDGFVSEADCDRLGFPVDLDLNGKEVPKTAGISQECRQRAKCLSHSVQIELRKERERRLQAEEKRKTATAVNKSHDLIKANQCCETKLNDTDKSLESFAKCSVKELQAFVHVRTFRTLQTENWNWPKKGKKEEAESGEDNLIKRAFDCSQKEPIFELPNANQTVAPSSTPTPERHTQATVVSVSPKQTQFSNEVTAASFLENQNWILQVLKTHDPDSSFRIANKIQAITPELKERANLLQRQMEQRLVCHCQSRIVDEKKRSHWCFEWGA